MKNSIVPCNSSFLHRLLAVSIFIMVLFSLAMPGGQVQAAKPVGPSYIIVFKEVFDPTGAAQGLGNA
jgi:hypothetical protein